MFESFIANGVAVFCISRELPDNHWESAAMPACEKTLSIAWTSMLIISSLCRLTTNFQLCARTRLQASCN